VGRVLVTQQGVAVGLLLAPADLLVEPLGCLRPRHLQEFGLDLARLAEPTGTTGASNGGRLLLADLAVGQCGTGLRERVEPARELGLALGFPPRKPEPALEVRRRVTLAAFLVRLRERRRGHHSGADGDDGPLESLDDLEAAVESGHIAGGDLLPREVLQLSDHPVEAIRNRHRRAVPELDRAFSGRHRGVGSDLRRLESGLHRAAVAAGRRLSVVLESHFAGDVRSALGAGDRAGIAHGVGYPDGCWSPRRAPGAASCAAR
jgi:hypothetical protein